MAAGTDVLITSPSDRFAVQIEGALAAPGETETDAFLRVAADRYRVLRTHEWSDEVLDRLRREERRRKWRRRTPPRPQRRKGL
jgi:hypothetical protein